MSDLEADFDIPQPLSLVHPRALALVTPDAISLRPKLAPFIGEIIARWADIEANLRAVLSYILKAEAAPVAAMLHSVTSASLQMDMILAAGQEKLFDPELEMLKAVVKIARTASRSRNDIAYNLWAYAIALPDALLLVEPAAYGEIFVTLQKPRELQPQDYMQDYIMIQPDRKRTMVYREGDFLRIIKDLKTIAKCTTFLINYLQPQHGARDQMYRLLRSEPLIDAALTSLKNSQQPRSKPQKPSPQTENGLT